MLSMPAAILFALISVAIDWIVFTLSLILLLDRAVMYALTKCIDFP
jgi:hypothetical protein